MPIPMQFSRSFFPPRLSRLREVESVAGVPLPGDIREHFLSLYGCDANRCCLNVSGAPVEEDSPYTRLDFLSLHPASVFRPIDSKYVVIRFAEHAYSHIDCFCYVLGPCDVGSIAYCRREHSGSVRFLRIINDSLQQFFDLLVDDPNDEWREVHEERFWAGATYYNFTPFLPGLDRLRQLRGPNPTQTVTFQNCQPPVTDEHFEWMETAFRMRFPLEIRDHYQTFNGGTPSKVHFVVRDQAFWACEFKSMQYSQPKGESGETMTDYGKFEELVEDWKWRTLFLPSYLWPLCSTAPYDDVLCFSSREADFGAIYLFATEAGVSPPVTHVADSFGKFLDLLQSEDPSGV